MGQAADELHIVCHVHPGKIRAKQEAAPVLHVLHPAPQLVHIGPLAGKISVQGHRAVQQAGQIGADVGVFLQHCCRVRQEGVAEVAHDELHVRPVGGHLPAVCPMWTATGL